MLWRMVLIGLARYNEGSVHIDGRRPGVLARVGQCLSHWIFPVLRESNVGRMRRVSSEERGSSPDTVVRRLPR